MEITIAVREILLLTKLMPLISTSTANTVSTANRLKERFSN